MLLGLCTMPYWNRKHRKYKEEHGREPPAEFRLVMGQVGGVLVPLALLWLALSTHSGVHWIVPVLASVPFGTGTYFIFTSSFTYIVVAYRPMAATALACNTTMRTSFAAAFPLFARQMYRALGTVGATLLLAGLTTVMAPLPYVYHLVFAPILLFHTLHFSQLHHHHHTGRHRHPPPSPPASRKQTSRTLIPILSRFVLYSLGPRTRENGNS
jgi:hypothetical protein